MISGVPKAEAIGLYKDHVGLAKFDHEDDFEVLAAHLSLMAYNAPGEISSCREHRHTKGQKGQGSQWR